MRLWCLNPNILDNQTLYRTWMDFRRIFTQLKNGTVKHRAFLTAERFRDTHYLMNSLMLWATLVHKEGTERGIKEIEWLEKHQELLEKLPPVEYKYFSVIPIGQIHFELRYLAHHWENVRAREVKNGTLDLEKLRRYAEDAYQKPSNVYRLTHPYTRILYDVPHPAYWEDQIIEGRSTRRRAQMGLPG